MSGVDDARVRQLVDAAARANAIGQTYDAERLVRQAESEAPNHPLVLNETAKRKLLAGDAASALGLLERAVEAEPDNPTLQLNYATALRNLDRREEELAALDKVLAAEPTNMRALLQAAALHEHRQDSRAAAQLEQGVREP